MPLAALLAALALPRPAHAGIVTAEGHRSFWIWGGIRSQPVLARAENLYILQGEIKEGRNPLQPKTLVVPQGMSVAKVKQGNVWLVYRATTMRCPPEIMQRLLSRLREWQLAGNDVAGLQIDFDAATKHLAEYAGFLRQVRAALPHEFQLSITGLLDWSSNGDPDAIVRLGDTVNEIIIQTYQGRRTVSNIQAYLPALTRLTIPFKIGLVQNGEWHAPPDLGKNPWFRGYVIFLQNQNQVSDLQGDIM
jgi:hypothetical protein